jgi:hypothetical protein
MNVLTAQDFLEMVAVLEKYNTYDGEHYYLVPGSRSPVETGLKRHTVHAEAPVYPASKPWPKLKTESVMAEGKTPGDGKTSPFGNARGATQKTGSSSGAHDFTIDPTSGVMEDAEEIAEAPEQDDEGDEDINKESVPSGGKMMFADPPAGSTRVSEIGRPGSSAKPYRLK